MPVFVYTAKPQPDKVLKGRIEAESRQDAIRKLTQQGCFPIDLEPERPAPSQRPHRGLRRPSQREIALMTHQLSVLTESGINIINSLGMLSTQTKTPFFKNLLEDVMARVKNGCSLSEGFCAYPTVFPPVYVAMVHAGEVGGHIDTSMSRLSGFLEKEEEFKESLRGALVYPAFILSLSLVTVVVLLTFVIPRLAGIFEDMGQLLPLPTKMLMEISQGLGRYGWFLLAAGVFFFFLGRRVVLTAPGRLSFDRWKLKAPLWGDIALKTEVSRLLRTLSLLLSSGIPILSALDVAVCVVDNQVVRKDIEGVKVQISGGLSLSAAMAKSRLIPEFTLDVIRVGEESGVLEKALLRVADEYEREVDRALKTLVRLLEPSIILFMGVVVGFIVFSMLLPIFQINMVVS